MNELTMFGWAVLFIFVVVMYLSYYVRHVMKREEKEVLYLLKDGELRGQQMVKRSGTFAKLKRGSIYVTLADMEEKGLIESREEVLYIESTSRAYPRSIYRLK